MAKLIKCVRCTNEHDIEGQDLCEYCVMEDLLKCVRSTNEHDIEGQDLCEQEKPSNPEYWGPHSLVDTSMAINHTELQKHLEAAHTALDSATCFTHSSELINHLSDMMRDIRIITRGLEANSHSKPIDSGSYPLELDVPFTGV